MNTREVLNRIRIVLTLISIVCLIAAVGLIFHAFITRDTGKGVEQPVEVSHRVLFLSSYNPLYYTYQAQEEGLAESLYPNGIEYDVFYMDAKKFGSQEDLLAFHDLLKQRLESHNDYEAVLLGDDHALEFALQYQKELFGELPLVFFGVNDLDLARWADQNPYMTGFYERDYLHATLDLAGKLFPEAATYALLHDESAAGKTDQQIFQLYATNHPDYEFLDINTSELTQEELIDTLEALPEDALFFYATAYSDSEGNSYSMLNRTNTVVNHVHCPIFRNYEGGEGEGVLGGVCLDFEKQCIQAGQLIVKLLNGADISQYSLDTDTSSYSQFDYRLMRKYGLDFDLLPEDVAFYNRPETFLVKYGQIMPPSLLIAFALLLLIYSANLGAKIGKLTNEELSISHENLEKSQQQMRYRAEHDDLLDMLNRRTAIEHLRTDLSKDQAYSIVMIGIDGFKEVNENYGHRIADGILIQLSTYLKKLSEKNHWLCARYGGDEFLLMLPGQSLDVGDAVTEELLELFRTDLSVGEETINLSASLGISNSDGITQPDQHILNAERAMYEAKLRGRNGAFIFAEEMKEIVREEAVIKGKLLSAFEQEGFYMLFQPQINAQTKQISGYEALVRMKEPGMYPGKFIPIAEKNGWIWRIGRITTELVIRQMAQWQEEGYKLHPVSVNFSSNQLNDTGYLGFVEELLEKYQVAPELLEIEITEGMFLEKTARSQRLFERFKQLGIRLLMDDFGTGYSSLGYLAYIPVDVIKLDKSLVDTYLVEGKERFIRDVIMMVHDLDKEIIIEGVEEEWQYEKLREFGADTIQGYYFSKPIPAKEAITFSCEP